MKRLIALGAVVLCTGCSAPPELRVDRQGRDIEIVPLKTYSAFQLNALMWLAGVTGIRAHDAIDCYRIVYPSRDSAGKPIRLSGLLALPAGATPALLVSYQHGTTSDRQAVPSNLSTEGLAAAAFSSGNGFATIAPDYEGLGVSSTVHPYYIAGDTARAVVDMIHAVRHIKGIPAGPPLLLGFSEGGYASLVSQRAMEGAGERVLATAAIAGAFNLRSISLPWTLEGKSPQASVYLALWVRGYAQRYGHPLDSVFTPSYAKLVPKLLDAPGSPSDLINALPRDPRRLFRVDVLNALEGHGRHWLVDALAENDAGNWQAVAPIRLYYGAKDTDVPPIEATTTATQMSARGSSVVAIDVGNVDHNGSVPVAAPSIILWFRYLQSQHGR